MNAQTPSNGTDWVAIIGALAWVPQIARWIYRAVTKPKLKLFPSLAPELGFSAYGTVMNVPSAIFASRQDAIIERITADLVHEKGRRIMLVWGGLNEDLSVSESDSGQVERHRRQQSALALKVSTHDLVQKTIMLQDAEFQSRLVDAWRTTEERRDRLMATGSTDVSAEILKSDEFGALERIVEQGFFWEEGAYDVTIKIAVAERRSPFLFGYRFVLSNADLARLRENVRTLMAYLRSLVQPELPPPAIRYNWRYPSMTKRG